MRDTREWASAKKLLSFIEDRTKEIKTIYSDFYKQNIGKIDKEANVVSLEKYILSEANEPLNKDFTIQLEKDFYILKKEGLYIPFKKQYTPIVPNDPEIQKDIGDRYIKYKPHSKSSLVEAVWQEHETLLKEKKLTKAKLKDLPIKEAAEALEKIGISYIDNALMFYDVKQETVFSMSYSASRDKTLMTSSTFYEEYEAIASRNLPNHLLFSELSLLSGKIEKEISRLLPDYKQIEDIENDDYCTIRHSETIIEKGVSADKHIMESFFRKEIDFGKLNKAITSGKESGIDRKASFVFYSPCQTLSHLSSLMEGIKYATSGAREIKFEQNDIIKLAI